MRRTRLAFLGPLLVAASLIGACGQAPSPVATPTATLVTGESGGNPLPTAPATERTAVVAEVNGEPIPRAQWEAQLGRVTRFLQEEEGLDLASEAGQAEVEQAGRQVLEEMIDELLIRQAAEARGLTIGSSQLDEIIARDIELAGGQAAFDGWLAAHDLTFESYRAATELQLLTSALREEVTHDILVTQPQAHVRHILLGSEAEAQALLAELAQGADFATLAASHSIDPGTREKGGDLGWVPQGLLPPALDQAIWTLGPGERSPVVHSDYGYHLIEMIEQDPARPLELEMLQTLQQQAWERWLLSQRAEATIERWLTP